MNPILIKSLRGLGLTDKQIKLYGAAASLGVTGLSELSKAAHIQRSTAYLVVTELVQSGYLEENHRQYGRQYTAIEPEVLLRKLEARHRQLGRANLAFREALPELQAAHQAPVGRPKVTTFSGKAGLVAIWNDILSGAAEVLLWTNQDSEPAFFDPTAHDRFINERIRKNIALRVLAVANERGRQLIATDPVSLRQTKLLPEVTRFTSEMYIYGDKVAVIDADRQIFGVITQNKQIAHLQLAIFEQTWLSTAQIS